MLFDNLGINIKINYYSLSVLIDKFTNAKSDFFGITWLADYPDPQNFLQIFNGRVVPETEYDENGDAIVSYLLIQISQGIKMTFSMLVMIRVFMPLNKIRQFTIIYKQIVL